MRYCVLQRLNTDILESAASTHADGVNANAPTGDAAAEEEEEEEEEEEDSGGWWNASKLRGSRIEVPNLLATRKKTD
jgi:hypothetical protein